MSACLPASSSTTRSRRTSRASSSPGRIRAEILEKALPSSNPDRTEDKAAAYLTGLSWLEEGKIDAARRELSHAVALSGYEYTRYRLALAQAHLAAGDLTEAFANATQAAAPLDASNPRLDLELDRVRAVLLQARVSAALGRRREAASAAASVLETWTRADRELRDLAEARRLARVAE